MEQQQRLKPGPKPTQPTYCAHGNLLDGKCQLCRDEREVNVILADLDYDKLMTEKLSTLSGVEAWNLCCQGWLDFLEACSVTIFRDEKPLRSVLRTKFYDRYASPKWSSANRLAPRKVDKTNVRLADKLVAEV